MSTSQHKELADAMKLWRDSELLMSVGVDIHHDSIHHDCPPINAHPRPSTMIARPPPTGYAPTILACTRTRTIRTQPRSSPHTCTHATTRSEPREGGGACHAQV